MSGNNDDDCVIISSDYDRPIPTLPAATHEMAFTTVQEQPLQQDPPVKTDYHGLHRVRKKKRDYRIRGQHPGIKLWDQLKHLPYLSPGDIKNVAICDNCGVFINKSEMAAHVKLEHSSGLPPIASEQPLLALAPPLASAPPASVAVIGQNFQKTVPVSADQILEGDEQSRVVKCPLCSFHGAGKAVLEIHFESYHASSKHALSGLSIPTVNASIEAPSSCSENSNPVADKSLPIDQRNSIPVIPDHYLIQFGRQVSKSSYKEALNKLRIHEVVETIAVKHISEKEATHLVSMKSSRYTSRFENPPFVSANLISYHREKKSSRVASPSRNAVNKTILSEHSRCNKDRRVVSRLIQDDEPRSTADQKPRNGESQYNLRRQLPARRDDLHTLGMIQKAIANSLKKESEKINRNPTTRSQQNDRLTNLGEIVATISARPWSKEESLSLLKTTPMAFDLSNDGGNFHSSNFTSANGQHQHSKLKIVGYSCTMCPHIAPSYAAWKLHMDQSHNFLHSSMHHTYKCACGFATDTEKNLWLHNASCQTSEHLNCPLCTFVAHDPTKLHLHAKIAHNGQSPNQAVGREKNENHAITSGISCSVKEETAGGKTEVQLTVLQPKDLRMSTFVGNMSVVICAINYDITPHFKKSVIVPVSSGNSHSRYLKIKLPGFYDFFLFPAEIEDVDEDPMVFQSAEQMLLESMQEETNPQHDDRSVQSNETVLRNDASSLNNVDNVCSASSLQNLVTNVVELIGNISASKTLSQEKVNVISELVSSIKETIVPENQ